MLHWTIDCHPNALNPPAPWLFHPISQGKLSLSIPSKAFTLRIVFKLGLHVGMYDLDCKSKKNLVVAHILMVSWLKISM